MKRPVGRGARHSVGVPGAGGVDIGNRDLTGSSRMSHLTPAQAVAKLHTAGAHAAP